MSESLPAFTDDSFLSFSESNANHMAGFSQKRLLLVFPEGRGAAVAAMTSNSLLVQSSGSPALPDSAYIFQPQPGAPHVHRMQVCSSPFQACILKPYWFWHSQLHHERERVWLHASTERVCHFYLFIFWWQVSKMCVFVMLMRMEVLTELLMVPLGVKICSTDCLYLARWSGPCWVCVCRHDVKRRISKMWQCFVCQHTAVQLVCIGSVCVHGVNWYFIPLRLSNKGQLLISTSLCPYSVSCSVFCTLTHIHNTFIHIHTRVHTHTHLAPAQSVRRISSIYSICWPLFPSSHVSVTPPSSRHRPAFPMRPCWH